MCDFIEVSPASAVSGGKTIVESFAATLLTWYDQYGRKDLPWQQSINPYRVWISEIMLQQTQVKTVIPYFQRFMQALPSLAALAQADEDRVLQLWAGLGYYARARNLLQTAKIITADYAGQFPQNLTAIQALPGIGRSTAGAIMAIAMHQPTTILDGNVKRVLTRIFGIAGWPGEAAISKRLWTLAERLTPKLRTGAYTQAIMDLGATLCTRSKPLCQLCPFRSDCYAYQHQQQTTLPMRKPSKSLPIRQIKMLILRNQHNKILLEKRPPIGIWGSLWSLPECATDTNVEVWCKQRFGCKVLATEPWQNLRHTFSHFHLDISPVLIDIADWPVKIMDSTDKVWYNLTIDELPGLASPIKHLLNKLS